MAPKLAPAVLLVLAALACGKDASPAAAEGDKGSPARSAEAASTTTPADPVLHRSERKLMGTVWSVAIAGGEESAARAAAEAGLDEVARLEELLSEWRPTSEISRVNQSAGIAPQKVGPELLECVKVSLEVARWSDGAFDISWAGLRDLWDFSASSRHVPPSAAAVKERLPLWNYELIRVDEAASTIFLAKKGMQIGLGGVAKGYALDRLGDILRARGFHDFLVFAGGQLLVGGKRGGRPWRVGIQHPRERGYFGFIEASDASIATSGDYEHWYVHEGRRYHHIIDPKTGFPSERSASVTVVSKSALWADAVDTALFIMGPERALAALDKAPGGPFEAVIVGPDLALYVSPSAKERLLLRYELDAQHRLVRPLPADAAPQKYE